MFDPQHETPTFMDATDAQRIVSEQITTLDNQRSHLTRCLNNYADNGKFKPGAP